MFRPPPRSTRTDQLFPYTPRVRSPESAASSVLARIETGDRVRIDLNNRRVDLLLSDTEIAARRKAYTPPALENQTPWQEIYRGTVGQLASGACLEPATHYHQVVKSLPRHSH